MSTYLAPLGVVGQNVQTLAIANTFTYGGIGGTQATTSGGSPQGPLISTHELGHSLGQLSDEYPYSSRDVVRPCYAGGEPGSFHHTIYTDVQQMVADQHKWWRWIGEESLSGGIIGLWEGGNTFPCGIRRPSQHSMMRWLGNYFDQIGREHMTYRITGRRNANAMALLHTPLGAGRPGRRAVGRDAASEVPRADGDLAGERRCRARYGQLAEPRARPTSTSPPATSSR